MRCIRCETEPALERLAFCVACDRMLVDSWAYCERFAEESKCKHWLLCVRSEIAGSLGGITAYEVGGTSYLDLPTGGWTHELRDPRTTRLVLVLIRDGVLERTIRDETLSDRVLVSRSPEGETIRLRRLDDPNDSIWAPPIVRRSPAPKSVDDVRERR